MKVVFPEEDRQEVLRRVGMALDRGELAQGDNVQELEELFAKKVGVKHAIAVSNGTVALEAVIRALGMDGGEVLVPTNTFIATAASVIMAGGKARLVDIDPGTVAPTVETLERALTPETNGVILVHIGGLITPEILRIQTWCADHGLCLIEDCAHAHGSSLNGQAAGTFGMAGTYSFFATKVMTSGEGGMVVTDSDTLAERVRLLRDHGKPQPWVSENVAIGSNWRMNELEAALGVVQLRRLPDFLDWRGRIAKMYRRGLSRTGVTVIWPSGSSNSWYKFIVVLPEGVERTVVKERMKKMGVSLSGGVYDIPLHRQPVASRIEGWDGQYPFLGADSFCERHVCLPLYYGMTDEEVLQVLDAFKRALGSG
jgi:dTDP-4-amino-4,6-dideoxygalactose transaminase